MEGNMFSKLQEMKQKMDDAKNRLDSILVKGTAGEIQVTITGNRKVKEIQIPDDFMNPERKEELEEMLTTAFNRGLEQANTVNETEMASSASQILPGLGGLGL